MRSRRVTGALMALAAAMLFAAPAGATMLQKMNLEDMTTRAGKIFRGTVISVSESTVQAGGGELPMVVYQFKVEELFKGEPTLVKGDDAIIQISVVGSLKKPTPNANGMVRFSPFSEVPRFQQGKDYLLFTSPPSSIGLSAPIGLGQGAFKVLWANGEMQAVNEFNNAGLGINGPGPVKYEILSDRIRGLLGQ